MDDTAHPTDLTTLDDAALATHLATEAGRLLLAVRAEIGFADGPALGDAGDARAQALIAAVLARYRRGDAVLSEEALDDPARLTADRVWIVDPLDGTREFREEGRADWAVHVALWQSRRRAGGARSGDLVAGAVALPDLGITLSANDQTFPRPPYDGPPRVVASRTRAPQVVADVVTALRGVQVPLGSAGAKVAAVVRGEAEAYVHAGGQFEWDSAAPVAVARAAGLHTSRLDGSPLVYNQPDPALPDLIVCRADLADAILAVTR